MPCENIPKKELLLLVKKHLLFHEHLVTLEENNSLLTHLKAFVNDYNPKNEVCVYATRVELYKMGACSVALEIIQLDRNASLTEWAWMILKDAMSLYNPDDEREYETVDAGVVLGIVARGIEELKRTPQREAIFSNCVMIATAASREQHVMEFMSNNNFIMAMEQVLSLTQSGPKIFQMKKEILALTRALSLHPQSHDRLRSSNILSLIQPFIHQLGNRASSDNEKKACLSAGSIIARLYGNDEDLNGVGPKFIRSSALLSELFHFLNLVLDAGMERLVYNTRYNPAFVVFDLLTIAKSDLNKPRFAEYVSIIEKAIRLRGEQNVKLMEYCIHLMHQLSFDRNCLGKMNAEFLIPTFADKVLSSPKYDEGLKLSAKNLILSLSETAIEQANAAPSSPKVVGTSMVSTTSTERRASVTSKAKSVMNMLSSFKFASSKSPGSFREMKKAQSKERLAARHVMISYNHKAKAIAVELEKGLREDFEFPTWIDYKDMQSNVADSMAFAVENASVVLCLVSRDYKESGNCRKECEYASKCRIPLLFLMVQEGYEPNGWLALIMGQAYWIDCCSLESLADNFASLVERVEGAMKRDEEEEVKVVTEVKEDTFVVQPIPSPANRMNRISIVNAENAALLQSMFEVVKNIDENVLPFWLDERLKTRPEKFAKLVLK